MRSSLLLPALLLATAATAVRAEQMSWSLSGFGTVGMAFTDQPYNYQRFISNTPSLNRDSVIGAQGDLQISPEWSATLQMKAAPSLRSDDRWDISAAWAFVSWRPNNDWLLRAGKVRIPLYLFSENLDVGQSYDLARMPTEMYSIAPTTDIAGLYVTRNWAVGNADLSLDVYSGGADVPIRSYTRDADTRFEVVKTQVTGSVFTWRAEKLTLRVGFHHGSTNFKGTLQSPTGLTLTSMGPGIDFYVPSGYTTHISNDIFAIGADVDLGGGWRVLTEFERNFQHETVMGANTVGGYLAVLRNRERWTPYAVVSTLKTVGAPARAYEDLNAVTLPSYLPAQQAAMIMAGQRALADGIPYYDQHSLALGTSFALTPRSKLKAEWMHTWVGKGTSMIDSPAGGPTVSDEGLNTFSFSYNFAF